MQVSCSRGNAPHAFVPHGLRNSRPARNGKFVVLAAALQAKGDRFFAEDLKVKNALGEGMRCCCWLRSSSGASMLRNADSLWAPSQGAMVRSLRCAR